MYGIFKSRKNLVIMPGIVDKLYQFELKLPKDESISLLLEVFYLQKYTNLPTKCLYSQVIYGITTWFI